MNTSAYQNTVTSVDNLKIILQKFLKNWPIFLLCIGLCFLGAFLYLQTTTPQYRVSSTLLVQDDRKGDGEQKGTAFSDLNMFRTDRKASSEMEALRARELIFKTLKGLSLDVAYFQKGSLRDEELYGNALPIKVKLIGVDGRGYKKSLKITALNDHQFVLTDKDQESILPYEALIKKPGYQIIVSKGPAFKRNTDPVILKFKNLFLMAESYNLSGLTIMPVEKEANTIIISLNDNVPQRGVDILTNLINTYNEENVVKKNTIAVNTINFIDKRLKHLNNDLTSVEQDVEDYKQNNMITDVDMDAKTSIEKASEYGQMLSSANVQLNVLASLEKYLNNNSLNLVPSSLSINNSTLNELTSKFNMIQQERNRMLRTSEEGNPLVQNLTAQLTSLKSNIQENLQNIKQGLIIERNNLRSMTSNFNSKIHLVPAVARGLQERSREQIVKANLYNYLLQKREETTLSLSGTVPTSQIVDKPAYNSTPVTPKTQLVYLFAVFLGFFIPGATIYGRSALNNKIVNINEIELLTGVPVLGVLNHLEKNEAPVIERNSRSTISELFRYIRSNLHFMNSGSPDQVMLVTSCMKNEGKTFFSINLGMTLASVNKRVVLLEFDMREPQLLQKMHLNSKIGITDYLLRDEITIDDLILNSRKYHDLLVVDCGQVAGNPAELMMHPKIGQMLEELKRRFDYVIIDTAPVGQVADAFSLSKYIDVSIYLVRYNYTDKLQLNILKDILYYKKLNNPMVVFNDAKIDNSTTYGYGGFGYGYGLEVSRN
ncbi:polysaccharide biosynthesis tyrosine autokinase [Pedobacter hiemivivus]|uniref:non-specific protein-tyrosine kinase n=1 Tax=Pedobacter hiemivivus TaxID=2530454 RepID=A0A4U1G1S4_9SPHI|nr:polysaccharide biosynthesis tyrosine autokinase [Pedobacter hiemivivus]TKC56213.1 polysaccharide biosynthesis tyrosine autokinase [Pedobacter hiemivivus]